MVATILTLSSDLSEARLVQLTRDLQRDFSRGGISVRAVEKPSSTGEKGDIFSLGQLVLDLVTSGTVVALLECLKAYLSRDRTLSFTLTRPDGSRLAVTARNVDAADIRAELEALSTGARN